MLTQSLFMKPNCCNSANDSVRHAHTNGRRSVFQARRMPQPSLALTLIARQDATPKADHHNLRNWHGNQAPNASWARRGSRSAGQPSLVLRMLMSTCEFSFSGCHRHSSPRAPPPSQFNSSKEGSDKAENLVSSGTRSASAFDGTCLSSAPSRASKPSRHAKRKSSWRHDPFCDAKPVTNETANTITAGPSANASTPAGSAGHLCATRTCLGEARR